MPGGRRVDAVYQELKELAKRRAMGLTDVDDLTHLCRIAKLLCEDEWNSSHVGAVRMLIEIASANLTEPIYGKMSAMTQAELASTLFNLKNEVLPVDGRRDSQLIRRAKEHAGLEDIDAATWQKGITHKLRERLAAAVLNFEQESLRSRRSLAHQAAEITLPAGADFPIDIACGLLTTGSGLALNGPLGVDKTTVAVELALKVWRSELEQADLRTILSPVDYAMMASFGWRDESGDVDARIRDELVPSVDVLDGKRWDTLLLDLGDLYAAAENDVWTITIAELLEDFQIEEQRLGLTRLVVVQDYAGDQEVRTFLEFLSPKKPIVTSFHGECSMNTPAMNVPVLPESAIREILASAVEEGWSNRPSWRDERETEEQKEALLEAVTTLATCLNGNELAAMLVGDLLRRSLWNVTGHTAFIRRCISAFTDLRIVQGRQAQGVTAPSPGPNDLVVPIALNVVCREILRKFDDDFEHGATILATLVCLAPNVTLRKELLGGLLEKTVPGWSAEWDVLMNLEWIGIVDEADHWSVDYIVHDGIVAALREVLSPSLLQGVCNSVVSHLRSLWVSLPLEVGDRAAWFTRSRLLRHCYEAVTLREQLSGHQERRPQIDISKTYGELNPFHQA